MNSSVCKGVVVRDPEMSTSMVVDSFVVDPLPKRAPALL
jgi:hypothetical protein